jgi:MFS family permease
MGRVIIGAIIGGVLGGLLGLLAKNLDLSFQLNHPGPGGGWQVVSLTKVIVALAIIIGAGMGGVIGAIAGAVSARPESRPVPASFWWLVLGILGVAVVICVVGAVLFLGHADKVRNEEQQRNVPIERPGPQAPQKGGPK